MDNLTQNNQKWDLCKRKERGRVILCMFFECDFWSPETTLRLSDLLEGLTRLSKAFILTVYYSEGLEMKVSEGTDFNLASFPAI